MRSPALLLCLLLPVAALRAEVPPLLKEIADKWADERQRWAFTQHARETDGKGEVHERVERFDLSQGYEKRWRLLKIDGREPTSEEVEAWSRKKNHGKKKDPKSWFEYVDLEHARVREEDARTVKYEVPLKRAAGGMFPGDKVSVLLTVDKQTRDLEHARASIDEPFNVALGLAEVVDLDLNLQVPPQPEPGKAGAKPAEKPQGTASAVVNKFGKRVEYSWSDFTRADRPPAPRS